jgi:hypothetical protein
MIAPCHLPRRLEATPDEGMRLRVTVDIAAAADTSTKADRGRYGLVNNAVREPLNKSDQPSLRAQPSNPYF